MATPHEKNWQELAERVHNGPGELEPQRRARAHDANAAPDFARTLVAKLQGNAASIVDQDVRALEKAGFTSDQIFEFLVSGSVHAGSVRLRAGLAALRAGQA